MKGQLVLSMLLLAAPLAASAEQLVPAGSILQCTISEPKVSSATEKVGDPVLCQVSHVELYGRSTFPYGSYLVGRFEEYKDPGHFVGKGWMELKFDRIVIQPDTVIPLQARVIATPKYPVDKEGRIHGTGHPVRDTVEWMIPVLWPIDLINLPRRGPRPVLKPETKLTLKVMDDFGIPTRQELAAQREPALISRTAPEPRYEQPAPVQQSYAAPQQPMQQQQAYAPQPQYAPPPQQVVYAYAPPQPVYVVQQPVLVQQPVVMYGPPALPPPPAYSPYGYAAHYVVPGYRPRFYPY